MKIFNNKRLLTLALAFALLISGFGYVKAFTVPVSEHSASPVALVDEDGLSIGSTNPIRFGILPSSVLTDGRKVVTSAGTAEAISGVSATFEECDIGAEEDNTGDIVIGSSTVVADLATRRGTLLYPGTIRTFTRPADLADIYIDSEVNGDGVTFFCQS